MNIVLFDCKGWYMVYCLVSDYNTRRKYARFRRTYGGIINLQCPIVISQYNNYMEGGI